MGNYLLSCFFSGMRRRFVGGFARFGIGFAILFAVSTDESLAQSSIFGGGGGILGGSTSTTTTDWGRRTVTPPRLGSRKRLDFFKGDEAPEFKSTRKPKPKRAQQLKWFWNDIAPVADGKGEKAAEALFAALAARRKTGAYVPGSASSAKTLHERWGDIVRTAAVKERISPALLLAVIDIESRGAVKAKSHKGAQGLMQLMPGTAARYNVKDAYDPAQNIAGGAAYLDDLLRMFKGDIILALAAYNAGENAVLRHGGVPPYNETRDYVAKVMSSFAHTSQLCTARAVTPRQSCTWRGG